MKRSHFESDLIDRIHAYGSRYALSKETGISQSALSRFVNGNRSLSLPAVCKLIEAFNLVLKEEKK